MSISTTRIFDDSLLAPFRTVGDTSADALVENIAQREGRQGLGVLMRYLGDFEQLSTASLPTDVQAFFQKHSTLPPFADSQRMQQAIAFFWKYEQQIPLVLACYSLPYCYAAADGAQVLWLSERIKNDTQRRLEETGAFVFGIMQERDWHNGRNLVKILKIRLMHAVVRYFTRHSPQWQAVWGLPINQEDMAGTNLAFSYIVIKGLRKLTLSSDPQAEEAYLHFWNVVGSLLGVEESLLPLNLREAYHLDRAIAKRQFRPSEAGQGLTKALMVALQENSVRQGGLSPQGVPMAFFLGDEVATLLGIQSPSSAIAFDWLLPVLHRFIKPDPNNQITQKYARQTMR